MAIVQRIAAVTLDKFGGAATGGACGTGIGSGGGAEPPVGRMYPVTLDELEGYFDSQAGAAVTGKDTMDELVKSNATLAKSIAAFTETNSRLAKKVKHTAAKLKKEGRRRSRRLRRNCGARRQQRFILPKL